MVNQSILSILISEETLNKFISAHHLIKCFELQESTKVWNIIFHCFKGQARDCSLKELENCTWPEWGKKIFLFCFKLIWTPKHICRAFKYDLSFDIVWISYLDGRHSNNTIETYLMVIYNFRFFSITWEKYKIQLISRWFSGTYSTVFKALFRKMTSWLLSQDGIKMSNLKIHLRTIIFFYSYEKVK